MRATVAKTAILAAVVLLGASLAYGQFDRETFGDFKVTEDAINAGVTFFAPENDNAVTNPEPFPDPAELDTDVTYPAEGSGTITVRQIRDYLAGKDLNDETFGPLVKLKRGSVPISEIEIMADGETVASGEGIVVVTSPRGEEEIGFLPPAWLDDADPNAEVTLRMSFVGTTENVERVDMAAVPEPVSVALFATGLAVLAGMRLRKERRK